MPPPSPSPSPSAALPPVSRAVLAATHATPEVKSQDLQQAVDVYQKATECAHNAATADEFIRAIELFSIAIAIRQDQARFFFGRGNAFRALNELEFAARDYTQAIALDDRTAQYYANRGACYRKLNRPMAALEDLTAAAEMDGKKAMHYFNRALVLYDAGFYREAIVDFTKTLDEGSAGLRVEYRALHNRGNCHRRLGNLGRCIEDLQSAIKLDGRNSAGFSSLAQAFMDNGDYDHAVEHFSNAIEFNNTQAAYFSLRGLCYYRKGGEFARLCLADFNQSIKLDGRDPQAYFYRGSIRLALALDLLEAQARTRAAGSTAGGTASMTTTASALGAVGASKSAQDLALAANGGLSSSAALGLTPEEQLDAAFADIEMAWTLQPKGLKFHVGVAMIAQLRRQFDDARRRFEEIHAVERSSVVVKYHWALCAHMLEDPVTALTLLSDCIDAVPDERLFYEARGLVLQETGHHELAIADLTEALALSPGVGRDHHNQDQGPEHDPEADAKPRVERLRSGYYLRAESLLRLERFEDAIHDATTGLELVSPAAPIEPTLEASLRHARAMAARGLGRLDAALEDLALCARLAPGNDIFHFHRGHCLLEAGRFDEALPELHAAAAAHPADASLCYSLGLAYQHAQDNARCVEFLTAALEHGPPVDILPDVHYRLGLAFAREHEHRPAVEQFTAAIACAPTDAARTRSTTTSRVLHYIHERAKAQQLDGAYDEAIADFTTVLAHDPSNARAYFRRGFAFKALGRIADAARDFETAKLLDPADPRLVINYRELRDVECVILCAPGEEE